MESVSVKEKSLRPEGRCARLFVRFVWAWQPNLKLSSGSGIGEFDVLSMMRKLIDTPLVKVVLLPPVTLSGRSYR